MTENQKRITLLPNSEISNIYPQPEFNTHERSLYFTFNKIDWQLINANHDHNSRLHLMLKLGYFKARHIIFKIDAMKSSDDIAHLQKKHFKGIEVNFKKLDPRTVKAQKRDILDYFDYSEYTVLISVQY